MDYHEIVNDEFNGEPVSVTYCPLCGSGLTFSAKVNGQKRSFGVSGLLYNSDVLLYDRETESLWSQIMMKAISGESSGQELVYIQTRQLTWKSWKAVYPETQVLSQETGFTRDYTKSPYQGYEQTSNLMFPVAKESKKLGRKEKVIGVKINNHYRAYSIKKLKKAKGKAIEDIVQGQIMTIEYDAATGTARVFNQLGHEIPTVSMYWFAWYAFHPETSLY